ncbi:MAG: outer membrane protein assembly factor BamE [Gammaproteobacteria bacterium]|nr:outer membrane protein assembly factor BamE [Gammaproteobacteria bacterium]
MTSEVERPTAPQVQRIAACIAACVAAAALLGGCVYRLNIQQGNLLERETIEQVEVGMTRSQVQFLLGTPTVSDTFHDDRWDYPYYFRLGRSREIARRWFVVYFDDDRVERIVHEVAPEGDLETPPVEIEDPDRPIPGSPLPEGPLDTTTS